MVNFIDEIGAALVKVRETMFIYGTAYVWFDNETLKWEVSPHKPKKEKK